MGGVDPALKAAENLRWLRRRAVTVRKTVDCLIATSRIEHRVPLHHDDWDFDSLSRHPGLRRGLA